MFIDDIRHDFYNILLGNRVLLLVHYDVDAICTCKILQSLFKCDNISYTLVPVGDVNELKTAYEENNEEIKYVVLVNCGGTVDLVDVLQPEEDVVFFVLDAHKPTDVCNVYSDGQVRLVFKDSEENIPNFDDIFRDDEDEDEEEPSEGGREALEAIIERRRTRRAWEERRHTLLFNYTQFSYYGKPSALVALELSWRASRCGVGAVWAGAVAAAAAVALCLRAPAQVLLDSDALHRRVASGQRVDGDDTTSHVVLEKDVCLPLYRWWSVEAALRHAPALAPHLKLHSLAGGTRLRQLLADMGFPLQQARQSYRSMDVELRRSLLTSLEAAAAKHRLPAPSHAAFLLRRPHCQPAAAQDVVYAICGLIEHETIPPPEGFQLCLSALEPSPAAAEPYRLGVAAAQRALEAVAALVNQTLSARRLHLAGPFSYFIVQEGTPESSLIKGPIWLGVAARWAAAAAAGARPLLASAPLPSPGVALPTEGTAPPGGRCLVLGVPPKHQQEPRNLFGAAFLQAAAASGAALSPLGADGAASLPTADRTRFLDALTALLA